MRPDTRYPELSARAVAISLFAVAAFAGCASIFNLQVLYEAPQPGATDSRYVMRLEKEQNPVTGTREEFPARRCTISERGVRKMMAAMYRRFFKDPATFVPPKETSGHDLVEVIVDSAVDDLFGMPQKPKNDSGSYRPKLSEEGHPASMSKPRPVFSPEEIDAMAPELVKAFVNLREGEHLTLRTRAFDSQGRGGAKWNESPEVTSVAIRFQPAGNFLGIAHGAAISWDFYQVHGLRFRGKGGEMYTYATSESAARDEFDFLVVFPREKGNTDYWRVEFPIE